MRPCYFFWLICFALLALATLTAHIFRSLPVQTRRLPSDALRILNKCSEIKLAPGPPHDFHDRITSDRFQHGTKPILIRNATVWTGRVNGLEIIQGDILLSGGLIKALGNVDSFLRAGYSDAVTIDAQGAWISPGIIDVHSHIGVESSPHLISDGNSFKGPIVPWLRALDALNTHDDGMQLAVSGGVTTSLILPGSANAIGGQGFVIKLRPTDERSPTSMLLEPPFTINGSEISPAVHLRWRHMKHACGENPARVYDDTRMDDVWSWRQAYDTARKVKNAQDAYCAEAQAGRWHKLGIFPEDLQWESLVDILRGKVKVQTHCYEATDIDNFVRLSNEFQFEIAAFHHAHEAYLVPDVMKRAYGKTPAVAIFASFARYKREAFRHSEFAPRLLADAGIRVSMKSDHPAIVSRFLLHEAQQAHHYGLPDYLALSSVTSTAASIIGLDHRIGYIKEGYDADLVIWDSHPLQLGATPKQVFIDGIPQFDAPHVYSKSSQKQTAPKTPDYDREAAAALQHDGLPPLQNSNTVLGTIVFSNVSRAWLRGNHGVKAASHSRAEAGFATVHNGRVIGLGMDRAYFAALSNPETIMIDLQGGSIAPALVGAGTSVGLQEISMESSTVDGVGFDLMGGELPTFVKDHFVLKSADGLQFATRDALLAYRSGVTTSVTAPSNGGLIAGLSVSFSLGASHRLEMGALVQDVAALHVSIHRLSELSVSTQIAALRRLLLSPPKDDLGTWFAKATAGLIPLVVRAHSADIIATLISLKREVEGTSHVAMQLTIVGAAEAHLLAEEIGAANVGVIVAPPRSFPYTWDDRRILAGPPLTNTSLVPLLLSHNVTVGIAPQGIDDFTEGMAAWALRNLRWDAGWVAIDGGLKENEALALVSTNIDKLLGVHTDPIDADLVVTRGGSLLSFEGKVVAVISPRRGTVDIF